MQLWHNVRGSLNAAARAPILLLQMGGAYTANPATNPGTNASTTEDLRQRLP